MAMRRVMSLVTALRKDGPPSRAFSQIDNDRKIRGVFQNWCKKYGKTYASAEQRERRLQIFKKTYEFVRHNATRAETNSHRVGLNLFADYTEEEFCAMHLPRSLRSVLIRPFVCSRPTRSFKPSDSLMEYFLNESLDMHDLLKGDLSEEYIPRESHEPDNAPELLKEYLLKASQESNVPDSTDGSKKDGSKKGPVVVRKRVSKAHNKKSVLDHLTEDDTTS